MISFNQNKYARWYFSIVARAQTRSILGYVERHHIVPVSLGGARDLSNTVRLTAREHFVCHLLLVRMVEDRISKRKMQKALSMMAAVSPTHNNQRYHPSSRVFEMVRKASSEAWKGRTLSQAHRNAIGNAHRGKTVSDESRRKMSVAHTGKKMSTAARQKMSDQRRGKPTWNKGKTHSEEARMKMSNAQVGENNGMFGKTHSPEAREKMRQAALRRYGKPTS
jgi:hypothetical protein